MAVFRWGRSLPPEALFLLGLDRASCHAMHHYYIFKALDVGATYGCGETLGVSHPNTRSWPRSK